MGWQHVLGCRGKTNGIDIDGVDFTVRFRVSSVQCSTGTTTQDRFPRCKRPGLSYPLTNRSTIFGIGVGNKITKSQNDSTSFLQPKVLSGTRQTASTKHKNKNHWKERESKKENMDTEPLDGDRPNAAEGLGVKPALKKIGSHRNPGDDRALKWDEAVIEEHDLLRGTRMKIDEPDTPYHYDSPGEEEDDDEDADKKKKNQPPPNVPPQGELSWDHLQNKLESVAAVREAHPIHHSPNSSHGSGMDHDAGQQQQQPKKVLTDEERKALEFKEHRKRHYNEMEMVRRFRAQQQQLDDEDEDDE